MNNEKRSQSLHTCTLSIQEFHYSKIKAKNTEKTRNRVNIL